MFLLMHRKKKTTIFSSSTLLFVLKSRLLAAEPSFCFPSLLFLTGSPRGRDTKMATLLLRTGRLASLKVITTICSKTFVFFVTIRSDEAAARLLAGRK